MICFDAWGWLCDGGNSSNLLAPRRCGRSRQRAQQAPKTLRVGTANVQPRTAPQWVAFIQRMAELGYREGDNFIYDHIQIPNADAWEASYRTIVAQKPDIVLGSGPERSLHAALAAADGLPVVMIAVDYDPVVKGYVRSLSRPSGNVTGVYFQNVELVGKRLALVKETFPECDDNDGVLGQGVRRSLGSLAGRGAAVRAQIERDRIPRAALRLRSGLRRGRGQRQFLLRGRISILLPRPARASPSSPSSTAWSPSASCASTSSPAA